MFEGNEYVRGGCEEACICDGKCADRAFKSPAEQTLAIADRLKAARLFEQEGEDG